MEKVQGQYLDKDQLFKNWNTDLIKSGDLISSDSYNEQLVLDSLNKFDNDVKRLLLKCAIHIAVIGSGNKNYGSIRDDDEKVFKIEEIFKKYNILYNRGNQEKYDPSILSARRLVRIFRFHIQEFILKNKRPSYLWFKYSDKNQDMIGVCFPGAEHFIKDKVEAEYLLKTYKNLDISLKTQFEVRLKRVFIATGVLPPEYFIN
jgi:hypothetical protein